MGVVFGGGIMNKIPYIGMGRKQHISQEDAETLKQHNDYWCDKYHEEKFTTLQLRKYIEITREQHKKQIARLKKSIFLRDIAIILASCLILIGAK